MREVNQAGLNLIKKMENDNDPRAGYVLRNGVALYYPYIDPVGVCTIGFGTIMYKNGNKVTMKDSPISEHEAFDELQNELHEKADAIDMFLTKNKLMLNENQFSALCSLAYNCGIGAVIGQDSSMRSALLLKSQSKIVEAFKLWTKGTVRVFGIPVKKTLPGLVIRRQREIELFLS